MKETHPRIDAHHQLPEVIRLSDRIMVMRNHAIVGEMPTTHQYDEMSEAIMARLT